MDKHTFQQQSLWSDLELSILIKATMVVFHGLTAVEFELTTFQLAHCRKKKTPTINRVKVHTFTITR